MSGSSVDKYALPGLMTLAGIHQYTGILKAVGAARRKHNVKAPATDGPPEFVRTFRAQQNHLEFIPVSVGSLWLGSVFFHPVPASLLFAGYMYGRQKYFHGYVEAAEKRVPGFYLSVRCLMGLVLISVLGLGHKIIRHYANVDLFKLLQDKMPALQ